MNAKPGDLVMVEWYDIQSDSGWAERHWKLEPMLCVSCGIFYSNEGKVVRLHASYNDDDIGDRIAIPESVVKSIKLIKRNVYKRKSTG